MPVELKVTGQEKFRRAAHQMAVANRTVQGEVAKGFRAAARPIVGAIRAEVRSDKGSSERGRHASTIDRQLHVLSRVRQNKATGRYTERQIRSINKRLTRLESLRENIASAAGATASGGAVKASLAFRVRAGQLPPSQRKLPRRWDSPAGWRHPVFGNRDIWVAQKGHPYFRSTINDRRGELDAGVQAAFETAGIKIMSEEA